MRSLVRVGVTVSVLAAIAALAGCSGDNDSSSFRDRSVPLGSFQLVAFNSCEQALDGLRSAAKAAVGPYGFGGSGGGRDMAVPLPAQAGAPAAGGAMEKSNTAADSANPATPNYSGTNTHEAGVDEPDLVKTDGHRIVSISGGVLRVVDVETRSLTGVLRLGDNPGGEVAFRYVPGDMLLSGDHALVLLQQSAIYTKGPMVAEDSAGQVPANPTQPDIAGPMLMLVNLVGKPRVLSTLHIDGSLVDARQVGSVARVVIRSYPRITFPYPANSNETERTKINRTIIDQVDIERWLPRIETTTGNKTIRAPLNCDAVSRPAVYSGSNMLTVLTVDVGSDALGDGKPTTLVADGDTVYSNGPSLYVASDQRKFVVPMDAGKSVKAPEVTTEVYKFDTSKPDRPRFVAGGSVPGYLINQYAMSEWAGYLRVATTTGFPGNAQNQPASESGIYVLAEKGKVLTKVGSVGGLGAREKIYAVRFVGPIGYVVTFRQTDPLYTVDIHDPKAPIVRGELKIPGYSAYLHPASDDRLIGIGQDASTQGRVRGTQVSLFDVSNLADPQQIAQYKVSGGHSEAEFDPHAFLFWPATGLLVVPLQVNAAVATPGGIASDAYQSSVGALVLHVSGTSIREMGFLRHPTNELSNGYPAPIRRSLVIDDTLWTVSDSGLMGSDIDTLTREAWIPFQ
jgi:hypothetical protein